jgi:hypothetical protein
MVGTMEAVVVLAPHRQQMLMPPAAQMLQIITAMEQQAMAVPAAGLLRMKLWSGK